jgi:hypothetical protein
VHRPGAHLELPGVGLGWAELGAGTLVLEQDLFPGVKVSDTVDSTPDWPDALADHQGAPTGDHLASGRQPGQHAGLEERFEYDTNDHVRTITNQVSKRTLTLTWSGGHVASIQATAQELGGTTSTLDIVEEAAWFSVPEDGEVITSAGGCDEQK